MGGGSNDQTHNLFNINTAEQQLATSHYLRYVVARYAALIDFRELSNEQPLQDNLIDFLADNLRQNDPYAHLISASWRRPDHPKIDINSPHWYVTYSSDNGAPLTAETIEDFFGKYLDHPKPDGSIGNKPLIIGVIGQRISDCSSPGYSSAWQHDSSLTTRIKHWTSFFVEAVLIGWGQSKSKEVSGGNYYDAELKKYIRAFANFSKLVDKDVKMDINFNNNSNGVGISGGTQNSARAYGLRTNNDFYAYIFNPTDSFDSNIVLTVDIPQAGQAMWYDPNTGKVINLLFSINAGVQTLNVPTIQHDIALLVKGGDSIDTPPSAEAGVGIIISDSDDNGTQSVTLDGTNSIDSDGGNIVSWRWSIYGQTIGTTALVNHDFKQGITPVTLSVTDDEGNTSTDFLRVRINNSAGITPPFLSLKHGLTGDWNNQGSVNMAMFAVTEDYDTNGVNHYLNNNYTWKIDGVIVATGANFWPCGNGNSQYSGLNQTANTSVAYGGHVVTVIVDTGTIQSQDSELYIAYNPNATNSNPTADAGPDISVNDNNNDGFETITVTGAGSDSDGTITGYFWYDGKYFLGKGQTFVINLSTGIHQITLVTVDNQGGYGDVRKVVTINTSNKDVFIDGFEG